MSGTHSATVRSTTRAAVGVEEQLLTRALTPIGRVAAGPAAGDHEYQHGRARGGHDDGEPHGTRV